MCPIIIQLDEDIFLIIIDRTQKFVRSKALKIRLRLLLGTKMCLVDVFFIRVICNNAPFKAFQYFLSMCLNVILQLGRN